MWTARSTRLYLRHFVSKYFLLLLIYSSFFFPADTAGQPQTIDCSLFRCERPRRILESPLSEISAKTSTTIETERVRRGEVSPRLRQRPGEAGEIIRRNKRELKFSQTFPLFLSFSNVAVQASELNFVIYFYINKSSLTNETNHFLLLTNSKGLDRNKLKLQI